MGHFIKLYMLHLKITLQYIADVRKNTRMILVIIGLGQTKEKQQNQNPVD